MGWAAAALPGLAPQDGAALDALVPQVLPAGTRLFGPGDMAQGFAVVLSGRIEVHLTGPTGREILLYAVEPGESCVQTTLGLLGDEPYSGEAICTRDTRAVIISAPRFHALMARSDAFRAFVFRAMAARMHDLTLLLERVAFVRVETRLAEALLELADANGAVTATHAELAARIGATREAVSRRLEAMAARGLVAIVRGRVTLSDRRALQDLASIA